MDSAYCWCWCCCCFCCNNSGWVFSVMRTTTHCWTTMTEWQVRNFRCCSTTLLIHIHACQHAHMLAASRWIMAWSICSTREAKCSQHAHTHTHAETQLRRHRWPNPYGRHQMSVWVWMCMQRIRKRTTKAKHTAVSKKLSDAWLKGNGIGFPYLFVCVSCLVAIKFRLN